jgi:hypothetical protein
MVLASSIPMSRKVLALAVVLIISSVAPASAVIGFCAKMPCCFGEVHDGPELGTANADCCTTISCYEAPSHDLTVTAKAKTATAHAPVIVPVVAALPAPVAARGAFDDTSPPPTTKQRLSSLSILLI